MVSLKNYIFIFTVCCTSAFHHYDSSSLNAAFPDVSLKTTVVVDISILAMSFPPLCPSELSSFSNSAVVYASLPSLFLIFYHLICLSHSFLLLSCLILYSITITMGCAAILSPGITSEYFTDFRFGFCLSVCSQLWNSVGSFCMLLGGIPYIIGDCANDS